MDNLPVKNSFLSAPVSTPASPIYTTLRALVGDAAFFWKAFSANTQFKFCRGVNLLFKEAQYIFQA